MYFSIFNRLCPPNGSLSHISQKTVLLLSSSSFVFRLVVSLHRNSLLMDCAQAMRQYRIGKKKIARRRICVQENEKMRKLCQRYLLRFRPSDRHWRWKQKTAPQTLKPGGHFPHVPCFSRTCLRVWLLGQFHRLNLLPVGQVRLLQCLTDCVRDVRDALAAAGIPQGTAYQKVRTVTRDSKTWYDVTSE